MPADLPLPAEHSGRPRRQGHGAGPGSDPSDVAVVAGVHAEPRREQAEELARQAGGRLVPAQSWDEDGLVPEAVFSGRPGVVVLEVPAEVPVAHVIGELADERGRVQVTAVVAVACLHTLHEDLASEHSRALVDCLEAATHHALVGAGPEAAGAVPADGGAAPGADPRRILAALRPDALPVGVVTTAPVGAEIDCAGWLRVLNGEWPADRHLPGVGVARYERHRPFHRGRLEELAERWDLEAVARGGAQASDGTGLRISGLCRLADMPEWTFRWDQVGADLELHPLAPDHAVLGADPADRLEPELLCLGPDLALFGWGAHADLRRVVADLDDVLLTDAEFAAGPDAWC